MDVRRRQRLALRVGLGCDSIDSELGDLRVLLKDTKTRYVDANDHINNCRNFFGLRAAQRRPGLMYCCSSRLRVKIPFVLGFFLLFFLIVRASHY